MAGDPADIGSAPIRVFILQIENPLRGDVHACHVTTGRVNHPLRLSRSAARVQHEKRMLGIQRLCGMLPRHLRGEFMPPHISAVDHVDGLAGTLVHHHFLNRGRVCQRLVCVLLERHYKTLDCESLILSRSASALKPPNTTLCVTPMRAHASIAIASSGTIPM